MFSGRPGSCLFFFRASTPPELLISPSLDIWSAGCILAELMTLQPVYHAGCEEDHIQEIYVSLGTTAHGFAAFCRECDPDPHQISPPCEDGLHEPIFSMIPHHICHEGVKLLNNLLKLRPSARATATDALSSGWFRQDYVAVPAPRRARRSRSRSL
eukprot:m.139028 g.139028  ORF g.139028 m.139028 type:complete len:156 (-) comp52549_c0_seq7:244-711(-)